MSMSTFCEGTWQYLVTSPMWKARAVKSCSSCISLKYPQLFCVHMHLCFLLFGNLIEAAFVSCCLPQDEQDEIVRLEALLRAKQQKKRRRILNQVNMDVCRFCFLLCWLILHSVLSRVISHPTTQHSNNNRVEIQTKCSFRNRLFHCYIA